MRTRGKNCEDERKKREKGRRRKGNRRKRGEGWRKEGGKLGALPEKAETRRKKAWELRNVSRGSEGRLGDNRAERKQRASGEAQNVAEKGEGDEKG